jgi:GDP-4-dehydro-6-deoxy-D-mannose reductase
MFTGPVLVTGAAGFAGSHLLDALRGQGATVQGWARPDTPAFFGHLPPGVSWRHVELLDFAAVREAVADFRPSVIFHLAGAAHVGQSWQAVVPTLEVNVMGTENILEADRQLRLDASILVTGSASVYRDSEEPLSEEAELAPLSPYAVSKLAQEQLAIRAARDDGQRVFVTRPFNHIGPRQAPSFAAASFARQIARIEGGGAPPLIRVGNLSPRRDLTDVRDTVQAYIAVVARGTPGVVYNVCSGAAPRMQDVLDGLRRRAAVAVEVETDPALYRPHDAPVVVGDHQRLTRDTGWQPAIPLEQTLDELLAFWREVVERDGSGRDSVPQRPTDSVASSVRRD